MRPVISGLIVLATSLILKAGELSPGLQTLLSRTPDREELKVLVVLEDQAPISVMDREMHEARTPMAVRHARVIRSLQEVAARSQPAVEQGDAAGCGSSRRRAAAGRQPSRFRTGGVVPVE